jgi:hypothetical protein
MTTPAAPASGTPQAPSLLYRLVKSGMPDKADPLEFIRQRRQPQSDGKPVPFRIIAQQITDQSGVDVTYEAVRRWWRGTEDGQKELADQGEAADE